MKKIYVPKPLHSTILLLLQSYAIDLQYLKLSVSDSRLCRGSGKNKKWQGFHGQGTCRGKESVTNIHLERPANNLPLSSF